MKKNPNEIGRRIRTIRENLGMTTEAFGDIFDPPASKGTISKWENGKYLPNNQRLVKIAELDNTTVDKLLYGTDSDNAIEVALERADKRIRKSPEVRNLYNGDMNKLKNTIKNLVLHKLPGFLERHNDPISMQFFFDDYFSAIADIVIDTELNIPTRTDIEVYNRIFDILVEAFGSTSNISETLEKSGDKGNISDEALDYLTHLEVLLNEELDEIANKINSLDKNK